MYIEERMKILFLRRQERKDKYKIDILNKLRDNNNI